MKKFKVGEQIIVITNDGKTTMAQLIQGNPILKMGVAKCNPEDKFDLETGAKLALERLFEKEESKKEGLADITNGQLVSGDIVKVVNTGKSYSTYYSWFEENNQLKIAARYVYGHSIANGEIVKILAIGKHRWDISKTICAVENSHTDAVYLIDAEGLKKVF